MSVSFCDLDATCTSLMKTAMSQPQLSVRAYHRVLILARIASLAEAPQHNSGPNEGDKRNQKLHHGIK